jgi:hypothetical protein
MEYLAYIIPVLFVIGVYALFKKKVNWLEALGQLLIPTLFILIFKGCAVQNLTNDIEYWNNTVYTAEYYESWDEWIDETCEDCETDSKGNTTCTTYDCSYRRYHSSYWVITDDDGNVYDISEKEFNRLVKKFGNKRFVEMNRDYDLEDGDKYVATWDGSDEDLEICVTKHTYENKTQAAISIYNFEDVKKEDIKKYGIYEYPNIESYYKQDHLLGSDDKKIEQKLNVLNAKLGKKKQVKVFVLLFYNKTIDASYLQEQHWKGGNKNEFVVCIGVDKNMKVKWCRPFSWTKKSLPLIRTRNFVQEQEKLDLISTSNFLYGEIEKNFVRRKFSDFNYLTVELTERQLKWLFIITFILSLILSIIFVLNDFNGDDNEEYMNSNDWAYQNRNRLKNTFHWHNQNRFYDIWKRFNNLR